jgi:ribosomal protein S3
VPRDDPHGASGFIIGKKGADIEKLRRKLSEMTTSEVHLNIVEVRKPEIDATWLRSRSPSSSSAALRSAAP